MGKTLFSCLNVDKKISLLVFCIGLVVSVLVPIHLHPLRSLWNEIPVFLGLFTAVHLLVRGAPLNWTWTKLSLIPLIFCFFIGIQYIFVGFLNPIDRVIPILFLLSTPFAFGFGATLAGNEVLQMSFFKYFSFALLFTSVLSVVFQCIQLSGLDLSPFIMGLPAGFNRPFANVAQPNQLALWLCWAVVGLHWLYSNNRLTGLRASLSLLVLLTGLVLTQSRIGWIIVPGFFILFCNFGDTRGRISRRAGFCFVFFYFLLIFAVPKIQAITGLSSSGVVDRIGGRSERVGLYKEAYGMILQHPWLGVGFGGFGETQVRIAADYSSSTYAEHAHNWILHFAAELGLPFTLFFFTALGVWIFQVFFKQLFSEKKRFVSAILFATFVHSMVEFPLWYAYILIPVCVLIGVMQQCSFPQGQGRLSSNISASILLIGIVLMAFVVKEHDRVARGFRVPVFELNSLQHVHPYLSHPDWTLFPQYYFYFDMLRLRIREDMPIDQQVLFEKWGPRFGFVHILNKLAEMHALNGKTGEAVRDLHTLQRLHPERYPEYYDYWQKRAEQDSRFQIVIENAPPRDAP